VFVLACPAVAQDRRMAIQGAVAGPNCGQFVILKARQLTRDHLTALGSCIDDQTKALDLVLDDIRPFGAKNAGAKARVTVGQTKGKLSGAALNRFISRSHSLFIRYEKLASHAVNDRNGPLYVGDRDPITSPEDQKKVDEASALQVSLSALADVLKELLSRRQLLEPFAAALITGGVLTNSSPVTSEQPDNDEQTILTHVVWESPHFGQHHDGPLDFSFGGRLGFQPAFTLLTTREDRRPETSDEVEADYQQAFIWDANVRLNVQLKDSLTTGGEASLVARLGQVNLLDSATLTHRGADSTLAFDLSAGQAELFWEIGARYALFSNPLDIVHADKTTINPLFEFEALYRRDSRFKEFAGAETTGRKRVTFDSPEDRLVLRFFVDALHVVDRRSEAEEPQTFTLGFGVEYERGWKGKTTIPAGTKILLRGDFDLLRALKGGDAEP
jgi:hypothetical protein